MSGADTVARGGLGGLLLRWVGSVASRAWRASPPAPAAIPEPTGEGQPAWPPLSAADRDVLVRTLYGEARGEPEAGQVAVVHVIRNRVLVRGTSAGAECLRPWQFSCWNAGDPNRAAVIGLQPGSAEYQRLAAVVDRAWAMPDTVAGARHYYAASMPQPPAWARPPGREVARIGGHRFWAGVA